MSASTPIASGSREDRRTYRRARADRRTSTRSRVAARADAGVEGSGGAGGVVLPMGMDGDGVQQSVYTLPIALGPNGAQFNVQVDTGSSDLWIAAKGCSSDVCEQTHLYDPSTARNTGQEFKINYLRGNASGPIYWDTLDVSGYGIDNQALAAVTTLDAEPLDSAYSGVLGLALPQNSVIQGIIPATQNNAPDGATFTSNLFGITPAEDAPAARFLSLALERPGMDDVPSVLGIGRHPAALVPDPSKIVYQRLLGGSLSSSTGPYFWGGILRGLDVWVNGTVRPVSLPRSTSGSAFPNAVLDTGVPFIITTTDIANAIYGAIGVGPSPDGQYYVPCTTPINMTVTLYNLPTLPLHPLDLTYATAAGATTCMGAIQTAGGALDGDGSAYLADVVLGVPFLRNTYTVLALDEPYTNGSFPARAGADQNPHLGLMSLLNITDALQQFTQVRVQGRPLAGGRSPGGAATPLTPSHGMSVGIKILIGILAFVGLCAALFGGFFLLMRRRWRARLAAESGAGDGKHGGDVEFSALGGAPRDRDGVRSEYTDDTARTRVGGLDEFGKRASGDAGKDAGFLNLDPYDQSGWRTTLTEDTLRDAAYEAPALVYEPYEPVPAESPTRATLAVPDSPVRHTHKRSLSGSGGGGAGVMEPLIAHTRERSVGLADADADAEPGARGSRGSMAGVGAASTRHRASATGDFGTPSPLRPDFEFGGNTPLAEVPPGAPRRAPSPRRERSPAPAPRIGAVGDSDYDFMARRSHAFSLADPPTSEGRRGRKKS